MSNAYVFQNVADFPCVKLSLPVDVKRRFRCFLRFPWKYRLGKIAHTPCFVLDAEPRLFPGSTALSPVSKFLHFLYFLNFLYFLYFLISLKLHPMLP